MQIGCRRDAGAVGVDGRRSLLHHRFELQARRRAGEVAVCCGEEQCTYGELNARANRLAHHLQRLGVGRESLVALYLDRGANMVAAILAVLKSGGAYVPMDLVYPADRIRFMLRDANPVVVVTEQKVRSGLPHGQATVLDLDRDAAFLAGESAEDLSFPLQLNSAAYVIYTSGSTGTPKGVVVTHQNVVRLFDATEHWYGFSEADVWTLFHSFAFDFSVWEMWGALLYGGKLVIVPHLVSRSPEAVHDLLGRKRVTVLNQTPSAFRQLIRADQASPHSSDLSLRWVIFGGEALDPRSLGPWFERHGDQRPRLVNMYGITETTVHVTYRPITQADVQAGQGSVIGEPIPDLVVHILDEQQKPCAAGVAGEIYVGGAGVARGYLNRPELTAQRFVPNPFSGASGERLYRSGDLARRRPDCDIEYLGRADQQVKIRGFRIEPGEIESALTAHPVVRECVVTVQPEPNGEKLLIGYLVCQPERPAVEELRSFLERTLPSYMVPAQFVFLDRLPLTAHGKADRRALPLPGRARPEMSTPFVPPLTSEEKTLAAIWQDVLQIDQVGVQDNFFALGGDSIRSIQVLARARERGLKFSLEQLFQRPTVFELSRSQREDGAEEVISSLAPFACLSEEERARLPKCLEDAYPMTKLQIGMVYHSSRDPASAIFHDVFSFRFRLAFDDGKLRTAVRRLTERHAIFRTSFDLGAYHEPLQLVHRSVLPPLSVEDLRSQTPDGQKTLLAGWVETEKRRPFDGSCPPFLRLHVQRFRDDTFQFIVSFHHVIMDGWSLAAMLTELFQDYSMLLAGHESEPAPPPLSYRDYVLLEREAIESEAGRAFWIKKLEQPAIQVLPRWPGSLRKGGREQVRGPEIIIDNEVVRGLKRLANAIGVPLRTMLLAAHCRVMGLLAGQADVLTGLVTNGRPQVVGGERLIGLFLNTVPFRLRLEGGTWEELVRQTFSAERELIPFRRCPLAEIQRWTGGPALFETVFDFVQFHVYRGLPGYRDHGFLEDHYFEANNFTYYLTCMLDADGSELQVHCDYDPNELCEPQIRAMGEYYVNTLKAMAQSPGSRYELHSPLPEAERRRLLVEWNQTARPFPDHACVHQLIEDQATRTPGATAAVYGDRFLNYAELDGKATALAASLRVLGVGPNVAVGIHQRRSLEMLVSVLAILKAGGAYVPLDPNYPPARLEWMMEDAGIDLVLTTGTDAGLRNVAGRRRIVVEKLLSQAEGERLPVLRTAIGPEDLAYVIYTSGSTGKPKGVKISHRALVNFLVSMQAEPGFTAADTLLAVTTLSFDIAALELLLPLTVGGRVVIASSETTLDPEALVASLTRYGVTVLQATPTTWRLLVQSGWTGDKRLRALCGGEAMPRDLAHSLLERCGEVWNMYGPTETTVWSCLEKVQRESGPVPIGRPIANTEVYLLDAHGTLVPTGAEGEIYISGAGLSAGYLGRPELTVERFPEQSFLPGVSKRLYRTGDLGRYLPEGKLLCVGRTDHQVKVRGFRIELEEVESVLSSYPAVAAAVVAAKPDGAGGQRLVAYYITRQSVQASYPELRRFLEDRLPGPMVPSVCVELEQFPLTPNGKVDVQRLPEPGGGRPELVTAYLPPRTPLEEQLVTLWCDILKLERVGIRDNFFTLGGHSLLAIQVVGRLRHDLGVEINVAALFENPTIEDFALQVIEGLLEREGVEFDLESVLAEPAMPAAREVTAPKIFKASEQL